MSSCRRTPGALNNHVSGLTALRWLQVLPRMTCWCDQDWYASVLPHCRVDGSDLQLPFTCPLDTLLNPQNLDQSPWQYRMAPFLTDSRLPDRIRFSSEAVVMDPSSKWAEYRQAHSAGAGAVITSGQRVAAMQQALDSVHKVHVLRFSGLRPGAFHGFDSMAENERFDRTFTTVVGQDAQWCCRCVCTIAPTASKCLVAGHAAHLSPLSCTVHMSSLNDHSKCTAC